MESAASKAGKHPPDPCKARLRPCVAQASATRLRDFVRVLDMLKWHGLSEMLPDGAGICLDVGCGSGRHRPVIERCGYRWIGMDRSPQVLEGSVLRADCQNIPFAACGAAAVVVWQVMEYVENPEQVIIEAARVLRPGGVFCGSVSFLEPIHGETFYGMSPLLVGRLLTKHGFEAVFIRPGLCGFALSLWTWLRRLVGPWAGSLAIPLTALWLLPLAGSCYMISWFAYRIGLGTGYKMRWLADTAPLEFSGHVMFRALKAVPGGSCTSVS